MTSSILRTRNIRGGRAARVGAAVAAAAVLVAGCGSGSGGSPDEAAAGAGHTTTAAATSTAPAGACDFGASAMPAARDVQPPSNPDPPTTGTVDWTLKTTEGTIGVTMDRAQAPCTVESMVSLTKQKYFDDTPCHRLTTKGIYVLQCGDPTGKGTGGPGYTVPDEFPTDLQPVSGQSGAGAPVVYPRGSVAMANTGRPHSGGSQFFLVYKDSPLPPKYTVFGTIDDAGLAVLDEVAAAGVQPGESGGQAADGAPAESVRITEATVEPGGA